MGFPSLRLIFLTVLLVYLVLQLYLFKRIRRHIQWRFPRRAGLLTALLAAALLLGFYPLFWRVPFGHGHYEPYPEFLRSIVGWWALGSTGLALLLLGYALCRRGAATLISLPVDQERRKFLKKGAGMVAAAPFAVSGYGVFVERERFEVEHFDFPIKGLSSALDHLSIVHLTDIHAGPFMTEEDLAPYVEAVNRLKPDIIALTGDFVSFHLDEAAPCVAALGQLKARYGIYGCLGNHDFYARAEDELTTRFGARGIQIIRNSVGTIPIGNSVLSVLGVDDLRQGRSNLLRAMRAAAKDPAEIRILLSHRPEIFPSAAASGIEVVLSGHYHGGQIKLVPGNDSPSIARLLTPYVEGLFRLPLSNKGAEEHGGESFLFVSRGIGVTALPVRLNCPPQIAHLTLRKA
jgi:uncharacterized protein